MVLAKITEVKRVEKEKADEENTEKYKYTAKPTGDEADIELQEAGK